MKLKKAHLVYFVQKDSPLRMDYRFNYQRTPESALKYRIGQWIRGSNGKLKKRIFMKGYDTREEAAATMSLSASAATRKHATQVTECI